MERETEATMTPKISESEPQASEQDELEDEEGAALSPINPTFSTFSSCQLTDSKTFSWHTGQETVHSEESLEEFRDCKEVGTPDSCPSEDFLKSQEAVAVAAVSRGPLTVERSLRVSSWTSSVCSTPPVPGAWPRVVTDYLANDTGIDVQ